MEQKSTLNSTVTNIELYDDIVKLCKDKNYKDSDYLASILIQGLAKLKLILAPSKDSTEFNSELTSYVLTTSYIEYISTHPQFLKLLRMLHHVATLYLVVSLKNRNLTTFSLKSIEIVNFISFVLVMGNKFNLLNEEQQTKVRMLRFVAQTMIRSGILYFALRELKYNYQEINMIQILLTLFLQFVGVNEVMFSYYSI